MNNTPVLSKMLKAFVAENAIGEKSYNEAIDNLLTNNKLSVDGFPNWVIELFTALLNKQEIEEATFDNGDTSEQDLSNLIFGLKRMIDAEWDDYGEYTSVKLNKISYEFTIYWVGDCFSVGKY